MTKPQDTHATPSTQPTPGGHTTGPWTATFSFPGLTPGIGDTWQIDSDGHAVCTTQFCYAPNTEANARLIASAPELLEAVWALVEHFERVDGDARHKAVIAIGTAAITKATGQ